MVAILIGNPFIRHFKVSLNSPNQNLIIYNIHTLNNQCHIGICVNNIYKLRVIIYVHIRVVVCSVKADSYYIKNIKTTFVCLEYRHGSWEI